MFSPAIDISLLAIGYSVLGAAVIAATHLAGADYRERRLSRTMGLVLLLCLVSIQLYHYAWLRNGYAGVDGPIYTALLFLVAPAFHLYSMPILEPEFRLRPMDSAHALPLLAAFTLPSRIALPLAFAIGAGYLGWLAHALYQLRGQRAGFRREIGLLGLGADENGITDYQRSKYAADQVLRGLPVRGFVLRPSLIVGAENASLRQFRRLARLPLVPLPGRSEQWVQPVHIEDLVQSVQCCLVSSAPGATLDLVGPEPMPFREFLARLRGGGRARYLSIPLPLVRAAMRLGRHLSPVLHPDNLRMLEQGSTADAAPLTAFLGHTPRAMEAG